MNFLPILFLGTLFFNPNQTIVFEEELRVAAPENTIWYGLSMGLEVDEMGNIYLSDPKNGLVFQINPKGAIQKVMGGQGQGPDQMPGLCLFKSLNQGGFVAVSGVMGTVYLHFFDSHLNFIKRTTFPGTNAYRPWDLSHNLTLLGASVRKAEEKYKASLELLDLDGLGKMVIAEEERGLQGPPKSTMREHFIFGVQTFLQRADAGGGIVRFGRNGHIYTAHTQTYKIERWNETLDQKLLITGQFQKQKRDLSDVSRLWTEYLNFSPLKLFHTLEIFGLGMEKAQLRPFFPAIVDLIPMDDDGLLVVKSYDPKTGWSLADLFGEKGQFICETRLPKSCFSMLGGPYRFQPKMVFRNQKAYALEDTGDFEFELVRYGYRITGAPSNR